MIIVKGAVIMNGNNENNNEGLNAVSLGSVENNTENLNVPISDIPPVTPIPEEPMEVLDDMSNLGTADISSNNTIQNIVSFC